MTYWEHEVSEYARVPLHEVDELDYLDYLMLRRDAFIYKLSLTEKGREYLDNAWRISQVTPDRQRLRETFGKGEA